MEIAEWQWDDGNLEECARHGLAPRKVEEVALESPRFRVNRRSRAATHQMIGPDRGGQVWVVCILQVPDQPGLWRAVTGWKARDHERDWHKKRHGGEHDR